MKFFLWKNSSQLDFNLSLKEKYKIHLALIETAGKMTDLAQPDSI
jgi:hypothetical protein